MLQNKISSLFKNRSIDQSTLLEEDPKEIKYRKSEVKTLIDKDLQLRYYIGGLQDTINNESCSYWLCDIDCSCKKVPNDERLEDVKNFIKKHNITNERFLRLSYNYLIGAIMKYPLSYSHLFNELKDILKPYELVQTNKKEIPNSDFREKELEQIISSVSEPNSMVESFIKKYALTFEDFISLAKTSLNYNIYRLDVPLKILL